jgi:hypothetical protein
MNNKYIEIISLFKSISKQKEDNMFSEKDLSISEFLMKNKIKFDYISDIGFIINPVDKPKNIFVSHIDLIPKFNKGFQLKNTFIESDNYIEGALDNTLTNAIVLVAIKDLIKKGFVDTEIILSENEETDSSGIENYLKKYSNKADQSIFINLDITNECFEKDASIEFDMPNFETVFLLNKILKNVNIEFTSKRELDDTDKLLEYNKIAYTHGLPSIGNIHSYKNKVLKRSILPYFYSIIEIAINLSKPKKINSFNGFYLNKSLKYSSFKKFYKKEIVFKDSNVDKNRVQNNFTMNSFSESTDYFYSLMFSFFIDTLYVEDIKGVKKFLKEYISTGRVFNIKELYKLGLNSNDIKELIKRNFILFFSEKEKTFIFNPDI